MSYLVIRLVNVKLLDTNENGWIEEDKEGAIKGCTLVKDKWRVATYIAGTVCQGDRTFGNWIVDLWRDR